MPDDLNPLSVLSFLSFLPFAYPAYVALMAGVLRLCGVSKKDTAAWVLRQAERQRFLDLIWTARGLPSSRED